MATSATRSATNSRPSSMPLLKDVKKKNRIDNSESDPPATPVQQIKQSSPPQADLAPPQSQVEGPRQDDIKVAPANARPLVPPPKPSQQPVPGTPDYFGGGHNSSHFSLEPNPFEQSFGTSSVESRSKFGGLPSVASLTSPAAIGPGSTSSWQNSLRSGPLSPAMLPGPTGQNGYFDESFRGSFPTPNESSLRTGLTPGGGGSMFPAPSPSSQAIYSSLQSGGATPGTLDFHRTAMNAAARSKGENTNNSQSMGSTAQGINKQDYQPAQQQHHGPQDPFGNHPDSDAVNSLYMLAQTGSRNTNQFAVPNQPAQSNIHHLQHRRVNQSQDTSPVDQHGTKGSIGSLSGSGAGISEIGDYDGSDGSPDEKPNIRTKGKRGSASKGGPTANGRRKAEETTSKGPASKRSKGNNGAAITAMSMGMSPPNDDSDDDGSIKDELGEHSNNGNKKMTDEEKRKNFLERNRVAALKCRQRKKQWLANLQTKVEIFSSENDALSGQCTALREEIVNLKTLLLAHKDCAVSHSQGLGGAAMAQVIGDFNPHANPYGISMNGSGQLMGMQQQGMQRS